MMICAQERGRPQLHQRDGDTERARALGSAAHAPLPSMRARTILTKKTGAENKSLPAIVARQTTCYQSR